MGRVFFPLNHTFYKKRKKLENSEDMSLIRCLEEKKILKDSLKLWEENFKLLLFKFFFSSHDFMVGISANLFPGLVIRGRPPVNKHLTFVFSVYRSMNLTHVYVCAPTTTTRTQSRFITQKKILVPAVLSEAQPAFLHSGNNSIYNSIKKNKIPRNKCT